MTKQPTFIDLFCGCGGWTEGFSQLGYKCLYSVDFWAPAALAHSINHPGIADDDQSKNILDPTIAETIKGKLRSGDVDVLIGSPPCTQFSFSNRGGGGNTVKGMILVRRFLEFVDFAQNELGRTDFPWVMENVPRLKVFLENECIDKEKQIYRLNYVDEPETFYEVHIPKVVVLNSADYGAPQRRRRVFCGNFRIPKPTHVSKEVKNNPVKRCVFMTNYEITEDEFNQLLSWRTLGDVLQEMPSPLSRPTKSKKVVDPNYPALQITAPQLHDHFYDTRLRPGVELFESHVMKQHHPVYGVMNFPDDEGQPARTVMATEMVVSRETLIVPVKRDYKPKNLGKRPYADVLDEYHNDSSGGYRRLTVRELACVQGFPITYQLAGKSSSIKHKQIGNAVSPFISRAFGRMFAYEYLGLSDIATISEQKLRLSKPKDYSAYDAYEHVGEWLPKEYKKNSQKFYAHLRTTKADGQRLDFSILPNEQEPWKAMLCLGSGKNYKRLTIDEALVFTLRKAVNDGQKAFNGEVEAWISSILNAIDSNKDNQTGTQNQEKGFDATGRPIKGSPFALVEQELDAVIRKTVNGAYDSVTATNVSVDFKSVGITRPISVYTIIAAAAMARIARNANQSR